MVLSMVLGGGGHVVSAIQAASYIGGAFLVGSVPFGLLIARAKGVDIRKHGSGNIGATNVGRVLGRRYFLLCFALDFLKGLVPTVATGAALGRLGELTMSTGEAAVWLGAMCGAVLGHIFCPWLGFKGGKGVATALGALMGVFPALTVPAVCIFIVWLLALWAWRYVSAASMLAGVTLPVFIAGTFYSAQRAGMIGLAPGQGWMEAAAPFVVVAAVLAALVVWTHRTNIKRLRGGSEPRIGERASPR